MEGVGHARATGVTSRLLWRVFTEADPDSRYKYIYIVHDITRTVFVFEVYFDFHKLYVYRGVPQTRVTRNNRKKRLLVFFFRSRLSYANCFFNSP